jgi:hypothetical protein
MGGLPCPSEFYLTIFVSAFNAQMAFFLQTHMHTYDTDHEFPFAGSIACLRQYALGT